MEYLKAERQQALERAAGHIDLVLIAREQGKAQLLKELLEHVKNSDALVAKLRNQ